MKRVPIAHLIHTGHLTKAIQMINTHFPTNFLTSRRKLSLQLKLQEYVEMFRASVPGSQSVPDSLRVPAPSRDTTPTGLTHLDAELRRLGRDITSLFMQLEERDRAEMHDTMTVSAAVARLGLWRRH